MGWLRLCQQGKTRSTLTITRLSPECQVPSYNENSSKHSPLPGKENKKLKGVRSTPFPALSPRSSFECAPGTNIKRVPIQDAKIKSANDSFRLMNFSPSQMPVTLVFQSTWLGRPPALHVHERSINNSPPGQSQVEWLLFTFNSDHMLMQTIVDIYRGLSKS